MRGFIVHPTYVNIDDQTYIQLYGRLDNGESFVSMSKFSPYFFVKTKDLKKTKTVLKGKEVKFQDTKLKDFSEEPVTKLVFSSQAELNKLKKELHDSEINTFEGDVKPHFRFMIEKGLLGTIEIDGDYQSSERIDRIYNNPELTNAHYLPKLKIASIDIETDKKAKKLYCVSIYSDNYKKTFIVKKNKVKGAVACKDEETCLEEFKQALIDFDPDIITGWNVIDFDFKVLKELFDKYKINFDLGRDNSKSRLRIETGFFKKSSLNISGRLVIDGLNFIRDPFIKEAPTIKDKQFISYSLENVSQLILKKGKTINGKENRGDEIEKFYKQHPEKLVEYNLVDCQLVYEILEKTGMVNLSIERSQLTGMPLDRITASIASFDSLYIREARKKGLVSPTTRFTDKQERIKGGFVMSPKPGIYNNVLVFDFKSLYPSIIRTFNIDPASFQEKIPKRAQVKKDSICAPNKACFKNQEGILPDIIEKLHHAREKAKGEGRELSSYAIKIIMNSFFGVLASPNCRYFNLDIANAITNFGQELIKQTAKKIEEKHKKVKVIYGDTDSIFVNTNLTKDKANKLGREIEKEINNFYDNYVKKQYKRKSFLELEFEKQYLALIMPAVRGKEMGAKKRYAGLKEKQGKEEIEIVGLEAIRGDWTKAAQEFQRKLLDKVFHNKNPIKFIKQYIEDLKSGELDEKLIYKKSIRKDLAEYIKTTPPHVKAARKLKPEELTSSLIQYYITTDGPEPIQKLKHSIDYEHYIKKQIEPIAKQILSLLNIEFEDIIKGSKQSTLF